MSHFKRADRVGGEVQKELSDLVLKEIRDPRLDSVTITQVSITDDLHRARVYFSVAEGEGRKLEALAGFKSASGYLRRQLSRRLELRHIPQLEFRHDESFERATSLDKTLKTLINGT